MSKRAVLLVNLGSPDSTAVPDVQRYLQEFLGDPRVIDKPESPFLRKILVNRIIIPKRAPNSAHAYESIWTPEGSPLIVISKNVRDKLAKQLSDAVPVYLAMRYGNPSIASVVEKMAADGITEVLLFPQYPQYAMSSWETVVVEVYEQVARLAPGMRVEQVQPFYRDGDYIAALVESARPYLEKGYDKLLISFHGIPERHLRKADSSKGHCLTVPDCCDTCSPVHDTCYRAQCFGAVREFVRMAQIPEEKYSVSFQSRLAGEPWLTPYTDHVLEELPKKGVKNLLVMTPAFVADCLETLEEIAEEGRDQFIEAGGEKFQLIPCLNEHPAYLNFLERRVRAWLGGQSPSATRDLQRVPVGV